MASHPHRLSKHRIVKLVTANKANKEKLVTKWPHLTVARASRSKVWGRRRVTFRCNVGSGSYFRKVDRW